MSAGFFIGALIGVVIVMGVVYPIQYWIEVEFTPWLLIPLIICGIPAIAICLLVLFIILGL